MRSEPGHSAGTAAADTSCCHFSGSLFVDILCFGVAAADAFRWELAAAFCPLCGVFPGTEDACAQEWVLRVLWGLSGRSGDTQLTWLRAHAAECPVAPAVDSTCGQRFLLLSQLLPAAPECTLRADAPTAVPSDWTPCEPLGAEAVHGAPRLAEPHEEAAVASGQVAAFADA